MATKKNTKTEPCQHRSIAKWPGANYGACTACGIGLELVTLGGVLYWQPLTAKARAKRGPATRRKRQTATVVQPSLFV